MRALVQLGMSVEQMAGYLPTLGEPLSLSALYRYLGRMRLPRAYRPSEGKQSDHDYYTFQLFVRFAQDASQESFQTHHLAKGTVPWTGARFRPDFQWEVFRFLFFLEMQITDLTQERFEVKFKNFARLRALMDRPFKALFVLDQAGEMTAARRQAVECLKEEPEHIRNMPLFLCLSDIDDTVNIAFDPIWRTADDKRTALLAYLRPVG